MSARENETPRGSTWEHREPAAEVLFVTNMWPDSERPVYGIFVKRQIESLREAGVRCDVLYVRGYRGPHIYLLAAMWFFLRRKGLRRRYRLIHAHAGETALIVGAAVGMPKVASYCGDDILGQARSDGSFSIAGRLRRSLIKRSAFFYARTITKSREMELALPLPRRSRNTVIPNGINEDNFRPMDRSEARRQLAWVADEQVAIFVATRPHEPRKRLDLARETVAEAERQAGSIRLFVAENVAPDELPLIMNAADCMLMTSRMEGSPNAVKEAIMCNLPVVSTAVGDVAELLDGVTPSAVCADEPVALGAALSAALLSGKRSNGRALHDDLRESAIVERLLGIYADAGVRPTLFSAADSRTRI